jgi:hypothetical protein
LQIKILPTQLVCVAKGTINKFQDQYCKAIFPASVNTIFPIGYATKQTGAIMTTNGDEIQLGLRIMVSA